MEFLYIAFQSVAYKPADKGILLDHGFRQIDFFYRRILETHLLPLSAGSFTCYRVVGRVYYRDSFLICTYDIQIVLHSIATNRDNI